MEIDGLAHLFIKSSGNFSPELSKKVFHNGINIPQLSLPPKLVEGFQDNLNHRAFSGQMKCHALPFRLLILLERISGIFDLKVLRAFYLTEPAGSVLNGLFCAHLLRSEVLIVFTAARGIGSPDSWPLTWPPGACCGRIDKHLIF